MNNNYQELHQLFLSKGHEIAEKIVEIQYRNQPRFWKAYGSKGRALSIRDAGYHLPFLSESVASNDPAIFTEYVSWVKTLFRGLNFPDTVMISTLECTRETLEEYLTGEIMSTVSAFIQAGIGEMGKELVADPSFINSKNPHFELALSFHESLIRGDKMTAGKLITHAVEENVPVRNLYMDVFQVSQYEVGRRWLAGEISVAQEHFCSAATQLIMSQLYPYIFSGERTGKAMVAATIGGELHEIGIRMVSDFFEMDGWNTYYLGANTPTSGILSAAEQNNASLIALSIAMPYHGQLLRQTIEEIRSHSLGAHLKILVGGNAVNRRSGDYTYFGADGFAFDAETAIGEANRLMGV